ncbi:MAG: lipid-A-disaccharide synthase [Candidatus Omnitrophica bacterium]|nr:lipid-A-disaccharide synthase [Candidatus Omnitrophota bacterium]MCF7877127.1 lipid-A-disaccharide synthase [Candidatus Omnitrophota bacterium]MCF7878732.1 lipid-A-disaccharide synthase [Candidatus Omnitrophota bacterium]MCF7892799.1 lipid-A-disaccharide synthase [Candidatus Omnitrophota bacterium]
MKKIVIIAGDTSGDLYGGNLARKINNQFRSCQIYSFGGKTLAENSNQLIDLVSHSVCGLIEVISSLNKFKKLFNQTIGQIEKIKPDLIILIDFPDFNLALAKKINRKIPIFYYVSPQVWAWRKKRIKVIKKYTAKMIPIFNFEKEIYQKENMDVAFFGHPLLEIIGQERIKKEKIISFLPGSRKNEIKHHLKLLAKTKEILESELPGYKFQVIKPNGLSRKLYKEFKKEEIVNHSYLTLAKSKFIVAASGTATIETAILEIPHIIIYKINKLSWYILKKIINTKYAGMLNILANRQIVPELLQDKATPNNIARGVLNYLGNDSNYESFKKELKTAKQLLAPYNGITKFAGYIGKYLNLTQNTP